VQRLAQSLRYFGHTPLVWLVSKEFAVASAESVNEDVNLLAHLLHMDISVRRNGKSGRVSEQYWTLPGGNLFCAPIDANVTAEFFFRIYCLQLFASLLYLEATLMPYLLSRFSPSSNSRNWIFHCDTKEKKTELKNLTGIKLPRKLGTLGIFELYPRHLVYNCCIFQYPYSVLVSAAWEQRRSSLCELIFHDILRYMKLNIQVLQQISN
jgi:hypothetical protein